MGANEAKLWPAENVEKWEISRPIPYARNSRKHSAEQIDKLAGSMREWGFTNALLVAEDGTIIAGHGRLEAAKKIGLTHVPVTVARGWTEAQIKAYVIADNQLAISGASWDLDILKIELDDLKVDGFDTSLIGFSQDDLDKMFPDIEVAKNENDPDAAPDVPAVPHSKLGDVWICGPHRVMNGDSLSMTDWDKLMQGEKADLCITDPPYNVAFASKLAGSIKNDDMGDKEFRDFLSGAFACLYSVLKPGASIYVYHADTEGYNFRGAFIDAGFHMSGCLIWKKNALVLGRSPYQWIHEPCIFGFKKGAAHRFYGGRKQVTVTDYGDPFVRREDGSWAVEVGGQTLVINGEAKVEALEQSMIYHDKPKR